MTVFDQAGFDARLEWGIAGARLLAGARLVVPVLRDGAFSAAPPSGSRGEP